MITRINIIVKKSPKLIKSGSILIAKSKNNIITRKNDVNICITDIDFKATDIKLILQVMFIKFVVFNYFNGSTLILTF